MRTNLLFLFAGLVIGSIVTAVMFSRSAKQPAPVNAALLRIKRLEADNVALRARNLHLTSVRAAATTNAPADSVVSSQNETDGLTPPVASALASMLSGVLQEMEDAELTKLKLRMELTPQQEQQLRSLLASRFRADTQQEKAMFDAEIKNVLTPEQYAEYERSRTDELHNATEMQAHDDLGLLANDLQLTESQKDQAFQILYEARAQRIAAQGTDDEKAIREAVQKAKIEALQKILSPDQFEIYLKKSQ